MISGWFLVVQWEKARAEYFDAHFVFQGLELIIPEYILWDKMSSPWGSKWKALKIILSEIFLDHNVFSYILFHLMWYTVRRHFLTFTDVRARHCVDSLCWILTTFDHTQVIEEKSETRILSSNKWLYLINLGKHGLIQ